MIGYSDASQTTAPQSPGWVSFGLLSAALGLTIFVFIGFTADRLGGTWLRYGVPVVIGLAILSFALNRILASDGAWLAMSRWQRNLSRMLAVLGLVATFPVALLLLLPFAALSSSLTADAMSGTYDHSRSRR